MEPDGNANRLTLTLVPSGAGGRVFQADLNVMARASRCCVSLCLCSFFSPARNPFLECCVWQDCVNFEELVCATVPARCCIAARCCACLHLSVNTSEQQLIVCILLQAQRMSGCLFACAVNPVACCRLLVESFSLILCTHAKVFVIPLH